MHLHRLLNASLRTLQTCNWHHDTSIVCYWYWSNTYDCFWEQIQPIGTDVGLWPLISDCDLSTLISWKNRCNVLFIHILKEWLRWVDECYDLLLLTLKHRQSCVSWVFECSVYSRADCVMEDKIEMKIRQYHLVSKQEVCQVLMPK